MARSQLFSLACLALLASSALAAPACVSDAVIQTAVLTSDKPKGCLDKEIGQIGLDSKCFESVTLSREAGPGCNGFNISLLDGSGSDDCLAGPIGNGTLSAAVGGGYTAKGQFVTAQQFTGTESADNKTLTVSVPQYNCVLTYAFEAANTTAANATAGNGTVAALPGSSTRDAGAPSPAATPAPPPKSGVAAALPSAALLVLGAVMALAL